MFTRVKSSPGGYGCAGYIDASFARLEELFGPPNPRPSADGKVSTEWTFRSRDSKHVSLYEYKETETYDSHLQSVEAFRRRPFYNWHIGAPSKAVAEQFATWLRNQFV